MLVGRHPEQSPVFGGGLSQRGGGGGAARTAMSLREISAAAARVEAVVGEQLTVLCDIVAHGMVTVLQSEDLDRK